MSLLERETYDYIIAGGGLAGVVVASRLHASNKALRIALIEAANNNQTEPRVVEPIQVFSLLGSDLQYNYTTVPQRGYNGRTISTYGGKTLGGGSSVNFGTWTRGNAADYDTMAKLAGDDRWNYENMLPYLRRSETYHDASTSSNLHGFTGPMHTRGGQREYPLRAQVRAMWEDIGLRFNPDQNGGSLLGFSQGVDNFYKGQRQCAPQRYSLEGVTVILQTLVKRVTLADFGGTIVATGVELANGKILKAEKEVLLACGAIRTPVALMLSGIGPAAELDKLGVKTMVDLPGVGENYHDHPSLGLYWRLKHSEHAQAMGHPEFFSKPEYSTGLPWDWLAFLQAPKEEISMAMKRENIKPLHPDYFSPTCDRADVEITTLYGPVAGPPAFQLPMNGDYIATVAINVLPRSRGSVKPTSTDPAMDPAIDPDFLGCEADLVALRYGLRQCIRAAHSAAGKSFIVEEVPPPGFTALTNDSSDYDIDCRIKACADNFWHPAGTASIGQVVDSSCKVKGVDKLRVIDTSVFPAPFAAHYQAPMYGIAERIADMVIGDAQR